MGGKKITYEDVLLMELLTNWEKVVRRLTERGTFRVYGGVQSIWPQSQGRARIRMLSTYLKTEVGDGLVLWIAGWNVSNSELGWCKRERERKRQIECGSLLILRK